MITSTGEIILKESPSREVEDRKQAKEATFQISQI